MPTNYFRHPQPLLQPSGLLECHWPSKYWRGGQKGDLQRLSEKFMGGRRLDTFRHQIDAYAVISQEIDAELEAAGIDASKRFFVPNGVDTAHFAPLSPEEKRQRRAELDISSEAIVGIFTGRLAPEKRIDNLISAWNRLADAGHPVLLLVVGEGPEDEKLRGLAGDAVRFVGRTNDVARYLQSADIFILPSVTEGLSNALLEGMASGLCPVSTVVGGANGSD